MSEQELINIDSKVLDFESVKIELGRPYPSITNMWEQARKTGEAYTVMITPEGVRILHHYTSVDCGANQ